ncbi:divalent metal cation transporter [Paenibacillus thiaminolyticus]|uniref:NRAMP family divalent metal transporter n=1 Tax=Paenibacillus thiaminolyticus TaxID=49283 RepID=UPI00232CAD91|nr:divalent metal cation transporter [Paenibacillus thiaminolyticus]WCF09896.1 divalent metal cation transporter [Paenibacillus thiaminolyticus]
MDLLSNFDTELNPARNPSSIWRTCLLLLGPGFITAATVLGPGSITVSSSAGALMEYSVLWVLVIAAVFMSAFTVIAGKIGCLNRDSLLFIVQQQYGRWLAILIGLSVFLITAGFQTGNNIGVGLAFDAAFGGGIALWAGVFLVIALVFIWNSSNFYKLLEKVMMLMVILMIIAFIGNLFRMSPDLGALAAGFVPSPPAIWGLVIAISATSFSIAGAAGQAYMVQGKGWQPLDLRKSNASAVVGIVVLCGLTLIIMITSAAVLAPQGIQVHSALDMAVQLEPLLGPLAKWLFLLGLFAASFSSFVANAVLGGMLLSDGFGWGRTLNDKSVKIFTSLLLAGSTLIAILAEANPIQLIIMAQASTVLGAPLIAIVLLLLGNNKKVLGSRTNGWFTNVTAGLASLWLLYLSVNQLLTFLQ